MGFSRQEYWCGLPFPSLGDPPEPGIEPPSPALQVDFLLLTHRGSPWQVWGQSKHQSLGLRILDKGAKWPFFIFPPPLLNPLMISQSFFKPWLRAPVPATSLLCQSKYFSECPLLLPGVQESPFYWWDIWGPLLDLCPPVIWHIFYPASGLRIERSRSSPRAQAGGDAWRTDAWRRLALWGLPWASRCLGQVWASRGDSIAF